MKSQKHLMAIACAGALVLGGCSKSEPDAKPGASQSPTPAGSAATGVTGTTNSAVADPFASADGAVLDAYTEANLAFKIGDYRTAAAGLKELAASKKLTPEQRRVVQDLLTQAQRLMSATATNLPKQLGKP